MVLGDREKKRKGARSVAFLPPLPFSLAQRPKKGGGGKKKEEEGKKGRKTTFLGETFFGHIFGAVH